MRITAGEFGGRPISSVEDNSIRPTTDKVRQAVFNMLMARVDVADCRCLDLFCGTGAMGLEALSRGAPFCTFVDFSVKSLNCAKANIENLGVGGKTKTIKGDAIRPHKLPIEEPVDLVFMDPPFFHGLEDETLAGLGDCFWLNFGAFVVVETDRDDLEIPPRFENIGYKDYGQSKIHLLQFTDI